MQKQNDIAKNLQALFTDTSYVEFGQGEFLNHPDMTGYYYIFKNITDPKFCIILNTSNIKYPTDSVLIKDYLFIIFNIKSLDEYMENLSTHYFPIILNKVDENLLKKNPRNLPYGYYTDENGNIKVDLKKAAEVRRIYDRYIDIQSVRDIVDEMNSNFSHIRDVLHSNEEYAQMKEKIVPMSKLKEVNELLAQNVKGAFKQRTTEDEIKELRQRRKQQRKMMGLQQ